MGYCGPQWFHHGSQWFVFQADLYMFPVMSTQKLLLSMKNMENVGSL